MNMLKMNSVLQEGNFSHYNLLGPLLLSDNILLYSWSFTRVAGIMAFPLLAFTYTLFTNSNLHKHTVFVTYSYMHTLLSSIAMFSSPTRPYDLSQSKNK